MNDCKVRRTLKLCASTILRFAFLIFGWIVSFHNISPDLAWQSWLGMILVTLGIVVWQVIAVKAYDESSIPKNVASTPQPLPPSQRALLRLRRAGEELREANDDLKRIENELKQLDMCSQHMALVDYEEKKRELETNLRFARNRCAACEQEHNNALQEYRNN